MANNNLNKGENILVKVDENNLIYIDPNSVVNGNTIEPRGITPENYVMYVNLEADLVPRSILTTSGDQNATGNLASIAKGTLNFLRNQNGQDYDTSWTDSFLNTEKVMNSNGEWTGDSRQNDSSAQSFGIDSINIVVKGMTFIPQVNINFVDVRGKTLFESPKDSPYSAFFHLPWPIFYLTVKGYYGKAIRYRLHMTKFTSKYNESNGNFDITCTFVGSTYAYMNDIPLDGILNAPYMYYIENDSNINFNGDTGTFEKRVKKSSKGYSILNTVYDEYKAKGLLPKDFPVKTLREVITIAKSLDKTLERIIFDQVVNFKLFSAVKDFEKKVVDFENSITAWATQNLTDEIRYFSDNPTVPYFYLKGNEKEKTSQIKITGSTTSGTLESLIVNYVKDLKEIKIFTDDLIVKDSKGKKSIDIDFKKETFNVINAIKPVNEYYQKDGSNYVVAKNKLLTHIFDIQSSFVKERNKLQQKIEEKMNTIIKDPNNGIGIGFDPTIRNIFGVILANADVYVRLMKDVHRSAFDVSQIRKASLNGLSDETPSNDNIYPWPEIKKQVGTDKRKVIAYPGDPDLEEKLKSYDRTLWPEIDFIENYIGVSTKRLDTLAEKEGGAGNVGFVFESNIDENKYSPVSNFLNLSISLPYIDKSISNIFYEIYERARMTTLLDTFEDTKVLTELANIEFDNIKLSFNEDNDLISLIKSVKKTKTETKNAMGETRTVETSAIDTLKNYLLSFSPHERHPYYLDRLPTVSYIKNLDESSFKIETQYGDILKGENENKFPNLKNALSDYTVENYRKNIYPYNSSIYLSYLNKTSFDENLKFTNLYNIKTSKGFLHTPMESTSWVKTDNTGYTTNLFSQKLKIGTTDINILNTPYFHKQLYKDFTENSMSGKYVGSAYLLLNSLPFKDLEDTLTFSDPSSSVNMASMFKEVSASHYVPYHLMLKWGSLYHRYKKYIIDGIDIVSGCTQTINRGLFFDNLSGTTFTNGSTTGITYSGYTDIGFHPFYENVFHNIINGYSFYNATSGNTAFTGTTSGTTEERIYQSRSRINSKDKVRYWTSYVDNTNIYSGSTYLTLLPCDGSNKMDNLNNYNKLIILDSDPSNPTLNQSLDFTNGDLANYRILWYDDETTKGEYFTGRTLNTYGQYLTSLDKQFSISGTNRKIIDLIATFSPDILDMFESYFIEFATERMDVEVERKSFPNYLEPVTAGGGGGNHSIKHDNFQNLLKSLVIVYKTEVNKNLKTSPDLYTSIRKNQEDNLKAITNEILSSDNLIKITIGNPKEINLNVWDGFTKYSEFNSFSYNEYSSTQLTTDTQDYIKLYVGEDIDGYYQQFFSTLNVELSEENVLLFRPLIMIFAGWVKSKGSSYTPTKIDFQSYISQNVLSKAEDRLTKYINQILIKIDSSEFAAEGTTNNKLSITNGYNDLLLKLELYNNFKSFNDRWSSGNSIGQRGLLEEFLFLDKANKDIGSQAYIGLDKLIALEDPKNDKADLYSVIGMLIQGTGFDMRALPAYVNFYGTNFTNKSKITSSKQVAKNIFGTYLDVDYQESSPKIILQYTGPTSKHLELSDINKKYKFKNDSGNLFNGQGGPLTITIPDVFATGDLAKSNKVVAFEVSIGDQNQGIFKGVKLDQTSIRNTTESYSVYENMGRSESGAGTYNVDIGLFDIYRQASYSCEVSCMGNVMIQPTMFFYLKNIPMFRGSYWITEVTHSIRGNSISTSFKGSRIPYASLPDPKDSFFSSYRVYFDKITNKAIAKVKQSDTIINPNSNPETILDQNKRPVIIDKGNKVPNGETIINKSGLSRYGIPYNGFRGEKYIQYVENDGKWLRAIVLEMGGANNILADTVTMNLLNGVNRYDNDQFKKLLINPLSGTVISRPLTWAEVNTVTETNRFYSTMFITKGGVDPNFIISTSTVFKNPANNISVTVPPIASPTMDSTNLTGPISVGPSIDGYGVALSRKLMQELKLKDGDVVYFRDNDPVIYK